MVPDAGGLRMIRFAAAASAAATCLLLATSSQPVAAPDSRALPMQFDIWTEGPAQACGNNCRTWVSASGAITADTPKDFDAFAKKNKIDGATIALDSDGGSVLGALALGRSIRKLGMTTTVGKTVDLNAADGGKKRAKLQPKAYCESMCAFVLLAGIERRVPAEARVMVHQIWLGDRRDDPTAANYSAEDLVVVQRDIGRLARYTVEMGGGVDLLEIALKIPPWEPMRHAVARRTAHHEGGDGGRRAGDQFGNGDQFGGAVERRPRSRSTLTAGRWWRSTAVRRSAAAIR